MADVFKVADYIIGNCPVDNLKLQKMLYYSQGVHMVLNDGKELFPDEIEAWDYGPVINRVYQKYKNNGMSPLQIKTNDTSECCLETKEIASIDMVIEYYGSMSGASLVARTHNEEPWKNNYVPNYYHKIIPKKDIYDYFREALTFDEN